MTDKEKKLREKLATWILETENNDVIDNVALIIGDYALKADGAERARYLNSVIQMYVACADTKDLKEMADFWGGRRNKNE